MTGLDRIEQEIRAAYAAGNMPGYVLMMLGMVQVDPDRALRIKSTIRGPGLPMVDLRWSTLDADGDQHHHHHVSGDAEWAGWMMLRVLDLEPRGGWPGSVGLQPMATP